MSDQMIEEWLKSNKPENCDGSNHTTLERDYYGNIIGRRDSIKTVKKTVKKLHKLQLFKNNIKKIPSKHTSFNEVLNNCDSYE